MSWLSDLKEVADGITDEFATLCVHTPMMHKANERARPDTSRAAYQFCGVFNEMTAEFSEGTAEVVINTTKPHIIVKSDCVKYTPAQGDEIKVIELGRTFKVLSLERGGAYLHKICLEEVGRPPMS